MIKIACIGGIFAVALWISRGYSSFCDRRCAELFGICRLLLHMEEKLCRTLCFGEELYGDFIDNALEENGFLDLLKNGNPPYDACEALSLSSETKEKIERLFSSFGKGYLEEEIQRLRGTREELMSEARTLSETLDKNKKVASALLFGISASLGILLI